MEESVYFKRNTAKSMSPREKTIWFVCFQFENFGVYVFSRGRLLDLFVFSVKTLEFVCFQYENFEVCVLSLCRRWGLCVSSMKTLGVVFQHEDFGFCVLSI